MSDEQWRVFFFSSISAFAHYGRSGAAEPRFFRCLHLKISSNLALHRSPYPWKKLEGKITLRVVQNRNFLGVTGTYGSKTDTLTYALDGNESKNVLPDGSSTSDRAEIRGRTLIIRSSLKIGGGELKGIPLHETQRWVLSSDSKLLTIRDHYQIQGIAMEDDGRTAIYARQ